MNKKYQDRDWLEARYVQDFLTQKEIGELCGVGPNAIHRWQKKLGIPIRKRGGLLGSKKYHNRDWLEVKYAQDFLTQKEIGALCSVGPDTIRRWMQKLGIPIRKGGAPLGKKKYHNREWLETKYIKEQLSTIKIAKLCNAGRSVISYFLEKFEIPRRSSRKYAIKIDAFKHWSWDIAYILGLIVSDGWLESHSVSIQGIDRELILAFRDILSAKPQPPIIVRYENSQNNQQIQYRVNICSLEIVQDLNALGIHSPKATDIEFPPIPSIYLSSFCRGVIDGDGSLVLHERSRKYKKPHKTLTVTLSMASKSFMTKWKEIVFSELKISGSLCRYDPEPPRVPNWIYSLSGFFALKFCDWIYSSPGPFLGRKKDKWLEYRDWCQNHPNRVTAQTYSAAGGSQQLSFFGFLTQSTNLI